MKSNGLILKLYALISILICGIVQSSLDSLPTYYQLMPLLPFVMSVMCVITYKQIGRLGINIVSLIIYSVTLVRYSIIPFLMAVGGHHTIMKLKIIWNAEPAIFLLCYECIIVYIAIIISFKKFYYKTLEKQTVYADNRISKYVILMTLFCIGMIVTSPVLLDNYMTIFDLDKDDFVSAGRLDEAYVGSIVRILRTLYSVVFNIVRIMLPVYLINVCSKRIYSDFMMLVIVSFFVFAQFMMITATFAESIVSALVILLAVSKLRQSLGEKIVRFTPFAVVGIILLYFTVRYQANQASTSSSMYAGDNLAEYICATVNAYFTGLDNVACSFNMPNEDVLDYFLATMQVTIPFNTTIFGKAGETIQTLYNSSNGTMGQIPPTVGNGYHFFGAFFAPFFSFLFSYFGVKYGIKAVHTSSYWKQICYYFIAIVLALGLGMYNEVIALGWINGWGIPMLFIVWLSERNRKQTHEYNKGDL